MGRGTGFRKGLAVIAFNAVAALVILETLFVVMLHVPPLTGAAPGPVRRLVQQIYRHFNRALIQFEPNCAQYDAGVAYTLKPGTCTFGNVEFQNQFHINRLGLRDDERSLDGPEIIVLGDSHAMGWGVEQDETLARVLARETGSKVLDAAISSYGTVREMMLLDRLDVSKLRTLIVQYSDNDLVENWTFRGRGRLPIMSEERYREIARYYGAQRSYYPGKYAYRLFMKVLRLEKPEPDQEAMPVATPSEEAALFLNALVHSGHATLDDVQIIVFEVNEQLSQRRFIPSLSSAIESDAYPPFVRRLITLDASPLLMRSHFYVLDDHMNASGHRAIGEALAALVRTRITRSR